MKKIPNLVIKEFDEPPPFLDGGIRKRDLNNLRSGHIHANQNSLNSS